MARYYACFVGCTLGNDHTGCCVVEPFLHVSHVEQPMPVKNERPCVQDMVIADIEKRKAIGLQRYGTLLQAHNGRDALRDAYEEALDLCQYLRQVIEERNG